MTHYEPYTEWEPDTEDEPATHHTSPLSLLPSSIFWVFGPAALAAYDFPDKFWEILGLYAIAVYCIWSWRCSRAAQADRIANLEEEVRRRR